MYCINLDSDSPYFNLAVEEILLKKSREEFLITYINKPSVIIGKHQVLPREANVKYLTMNHIPVVRRISGGGTVFHDEGNLNFTFIRNAEEGKQIDFRKNTQTAINFLLSQEVDARFEGKNDLRVGGLKISGNAEHVHRNRVLHHGTLLFSTSLDILRNCLRKDPTCYSSRGVESIRSSVTNLKELLKNFRDISEFRSGLVKFFMDNIPGAEDYALSQNEINDAELLAESRYTTWEWNWAYGPEYQFNSSFAIQNEPVTCRLFVKEGIIRECDIEGSFKIADAGRYLPGCRHLPDDMIKIFEGEGIYLENEDIFKFF